MSESTRRSMLFPPQDNGRSGLPMPMPSSAVKNHTLNFTHNKRLSVAGPASRGAYPPATLTVPSTHPTPSLNRSQNLDPLLASASKNGQTPLKSSTRRGSLWASGVGAPPPVTAQVLKDTRPLRDRQYQTKMRQDIVSWLGGTEYDISIQTLTNMTGKDYRNVFQFLLSMLDPGYSFDPQVRFEEEFVSALKCVQYPFVGQVDPKWLAAPASMHSWPSLLGVLHWLVCMCKGRLAYMDSGHPTLQYSEIIPEKFDHPDHHSALAFDYFTEAYEIFCTGSDVFVDQQLKLEERYAKKDEQTEVELEELRVELAKVKAKYDKLQSSPAPIDKRLSDNQCMKRDFEKFQECIHNWEGRKKTLISHIANLKIDITQQSSNLEQLEAEQERLSEVVKEQNISPDEVVRMNTEHEQLAQGIDELKAKIAETQKDVHSLEVAVANHGAAAEEAVDAYTTLLSDLGLFPPLPRPFQDIDLRMVLNTAASQPENLLKGLDIRHVIRPTLNDILEAKRDERIAVNNQRIQMDHEFDELISECEKLEDEINETEKTVMVLDEQAEDLRETAQREALVNNAEIKRLERNLTLARTAALSGGAGVESQLQTLQIAYREQMQKIARLQEETVRAIVKNSTEIAMFKEMTSQQLKDLRDFATRTYREPVSTMTK
ncbi:HEC/Ndc80p family-domain-containing protein [Lactarius akahatsu]|uniref:Kinetochore protein NDC80 n=1 Tax=Lactarius akahatsu TaxID=416441 RepID=A0AAD4QIF3_9AGAM|nr:HEC/Ndc80p family-domain-containing protein [Lactarius akahatsu]